MDWHAANVPRLRILARQRAVSCAFSSLSMVSPCLATSPQALLHSSLDATLSGRRRKWPVRKTLPRYEPRLRCCAVHCANFDCFFGRFSE